MADEEYSDEKLEQELEEGWGEEDQALLEEMEEEEIDDSDLGAYPEDDEDDFGE